MILQRICNLKRLVKYVSAPHPLFIIDLILLKSMRRPGIEPGSKPWEGFILTDILAALDILLSVRFL